MNRGFVLLLVLLVGLGLPRPALGQEVGDPVVTFATVLANRAVLIGTDCGGETAYWVEPYGGMTILASHSPGGPLVATPPIPFPNPRPGPESDWCPGALVPGAPPGTYWAVMVYGLTNHTSAPVSAWQRVVVGPTTCTAPPQPPLLVEGSPSISGNSVALAFSSTYTGCAIDRIDLEVGTTPGGSNSGVFPLSGLTSFYQNVPAGTYYARARGVNAYGRSNPSTEIPLRVPGPCEANSLPPTPVNPVVTVNGSQVTISWTLSPPSGALFHQLTLLDPGSGVAVDHLLLSSATSVSAANVRSGNYRVRVSSGNACGIKAMVPLSYLDFTVP